MTARLLTDSFTRMFALAAAVGGVSGLVGVYISWFVDVSSGATVVLLQGALFVVALGWTMVRSRWPGTGGGERLAAIEGTTLD